MSQVKTRMSRSQPLGRNRSANAFASASRTAEENWESHWEATRWELRAMDEVSCRIVESVPSSICSKAGRARHLGV